MKRPHVVSEKCGCCSDEQRKRFILDTDTECAKKVRTESADGDGSSEQDFSETMDETQGTIPYTFSGSPEYNTDTEETSPIMCDSEDEKNDTETSKLKSQSKSNTGPDSLSDSQTNGNENIATAEYNSSNTQSTQGSTQSYDMLSQVVNNTADGNIEGQDSSSTDKTLSYDLQPDDTPDEIQEAEQDNSDISSSKHADNDIQILYSDSSSSFVGKTIIMDDNTQIQPTTSSDCVIYCGGEPKPKRRCTRNAQNSNNNGNIFNKASNCAANKATSTSLINIQSQAPGESVSESLDNRTEIKQSLKKIPSVLKDAETIKSVFVDIDFEVIYKKLKERRKSANRLDEVTNDIIEGNIEVSETKQGENFQADQPLLNGEVKDDIMLDLEKIAKQFADVDPNEIFIMLEAKTDIESRQQQVVQQLLARKPVTAPNNIIVIEDDATEIVTTIRNNNDPLHKDMVELSEMFPDVNRNEIYAYLEAHYVKPNRKQIVTEELLRQQQGSQSLTDYQDFTITDAADGTVCKKTKKSQNKSGQSASTSNNVKDQSQPLTQIELDVKELKLIFPDCDPNYFFGLLEKNTDPERVQKIAGSMFENKNYPKLKDRLAEEEKLSYKNQLRNMKFEVREFLQMFADPITQFYDESKPVGTSYKEHANIQLVNYFPRMKTDHIKQVLEKHGNHFTPALRELETESEQASGRKSRKKNIEKKSKEKKNTGNFLKTPRKALLILPVEPDELFFKERLFTQHETDIKDYLEKRKSERNEKFNKAKDNCELYECQCCFDDEVLFEEMTTCTDGHLFCQECVRRSTETLIGDGKTNFPCLTGTCEHVFSTNTLQGLLPPKIFSNILKRMQDEEIKSAGIDDLVSCPFCSFATIMPNENDKVFKCLNQDCLKESCRLCKEQNHIPLRCEEVEKQGETNIRTYIENKISEAMLRTCWKCRKRFFKVEGCNKMTCTCGASMCYVCREPIKDYSHFNGKGKCPPNTNVFELHKKEMEKAGLAAKKKFEKEGKTTDLKHDPMQYVQEYKTKVPEQVHHPYNEYGDDDDSEDEYGNYGGNYYSSNSNSEEDDYW